MLRLVKADDTSATQPSAVSDAAAAEAAASIDTASDTSGAFATCRAYRQIDQLLWRVLQLDDILHHGCAFNPKKAARIKRQLEEKQDQLERVYAQIGSRRRERGRPRMHLVNS